MCFFSEAVCIHQVEEEQQQDKREVLEETVELRSWNQQKDNYNDDTQVNTHISISATH